MRRSIPRIGVTGGIGGGKSLVCQIFRHLGIPVYNADDNAKKLMTQNAKLAAQIKERFGEQSYREGALNRAYLARTVFSNAAKLAELNQLVHPAVNEDFENWYKNLPPSTPYCIKEAALLYETGSYKSLDKTIVAYAPESTRVQRVLKRDAHRTEADIKAIINKQMDEEEKRRRADYVIINDGRRLVIPQVLEFHNALIERSASPASGDI